MESNDDRFSPSDLVVEDGQPPKRRRMSPRPAREVGLMRSIPGDNSTGFVGSASGIFFIRSVYGAIRRSQPNHMETPGSDIVPGEDDQLPSVLSGVSGHLWNDDEVGQRQMLNVSFQDLIEWSGSYFANWHPAFPFLHAPAVLEHFDELSRNGPSPQDISGDLRMIVLRSIMSISLADRRQSSNSGGAHFPAELVFPSYDAAVDSLRHVLSHPASLSSLQAAVSVQLFLVSMLRLNAASRLGGLIIRMALQLGLHRCPSRFPSFSPRVKELRQRIFWSVYTIDRFICQSMGLPLGIHDDDLDVCYPITERHLEVQDHRPDSRLRLLELLARHAEMRGEIIELRNKSLHFIQKDPDRATAIEARLAQWWNDVEDFSDTDDSQGPSAYHLTILTVLKHESIISLNRPALAASRQDASYDVALQLCIGSARSIITTLHKALSSRDNPEPLTLLWPSCTWAVWISTFIMFYAAHSKHVSQVIVARLADRSLEVLEHLSRRGCAWPEASAAAIRDLRTKMIDQESATLAGDQNAPDEASTGTNFGLSPSQSRSGPSPHGNPASASVPTNRPIAIHNADIAASSTGIGYTSDFNPYPTVDSNAHDNLDHETLAFGLGNSNWNNFMNANGSLAQNTAHGDHNNPDPFSGFDIPFWFEQEQHWDMLL
ncbi:fungal-specific transcription factor domain-containing protein [Pyrenochaeta sp. MPI-SDFR-AT-0127]|nr:fungal-specific transcription factor domain-containing protein [Pyrenochaeta sp. MPI-SDFR-AT-0127]